MTATPPVPASEKARGCRAWENEKEPGGGTLTSRCAGGSAQGVTPTQGRTARTPGRPHTAATRGFCPSALELTFLSCSSNSRSESGHRFFPLFGVKSSQVGLGVASQSRLPHVVRSLGMVGCWSHPLSPDSRWPVTTASGALAVLRACLRPVPEGAGRVTVSASSAFLLPALHSFPV